MKIVKRVGMILVGLFAVLVIALAVYARNPYTALPEMNDAIDDLDTSMVTVYEDWDEIKYTVTNPQKNIVIIPGGLVTPDSYSFLAISIAKEGYNVTISKAPFNLAILAPNYAKRFLSDELENVIIGHSLGGVVGSMLASGRDEVTQVIMMGSYPIQDLTDKETLMITAEFDLGMDPEAFDSSLEYVNSENIIFPITGGNHAQFGWYGPQKGDGEAVLTTLEQQLIVIEQIILFIGDQT